MVGQLSAGILQRFSATLLLTALALGVAGDLLLRATPWGINVAIFVAAVAVAALGLRYVGGRTAAFSTGWLLVASFFACLFAVRASETVQVLCFVAVLVSLCMASFALPDRRLRAAGLTAIAAHVVIAATLSLGSLALVLARGIDYRLATSSRHLRALPAIGRGFLVAAPVVGVFTGLFAAADVLFRDLLVDVLAFDAETAWSHVALTLFIGWLAGSYAASLVATPVPAVNAIEPPERIRLGGVEIGILFGLVNAVFLAFVLVQFRYLFGGADRVEGATTLTFAEYARRGFFELVIVAALVVVLLLSSHWVLKDESRTRRLFVPLAAALLVLVLVVLASAAERMRLYMENYGLTELRLYTSIFMAWLLVMLLWLAATVLRGSRDRFAFGAFGSGLVLVVVTGALNTDALIVRQNVSAATADRPLDIEYLVDLGPDGIPALIGSLAGLSPDERCRVTTEARERYADQGGDWRTWNYGRWNAARATRPNAAAGACE